MSLWSQSVKKQMEIVEKKRVLLKLYSLVEKI